MWGFQLWPMILWEHTIAQVHVQPRVSRWTALDFFWPFVDGVCPRPDLP